MTTLLTGLPRTRRSYSQDFKAQVVAACLQPGASAAAVAMAHQLNANLARRWIREHEGRSRVTSSPGPRLIPLAVQPDPASASGHFHLDLHHAKVAMQVTWPVDQASACALWLREFLRPA